MLAPGPALGGSERDSRGRSAYLGGREKVLAWLAFNDAATPPVPVPVTGRWHKAILGPGTHAAQVQRQGRVHALGVNTKPVFKLMNHVAHGIKFESLQTSA
jgi:hypothetical protein